MGMSHRNFQQQKKPVKIGEDFNLSIEPNIFNLSIEANFCRKRHAISHFSRGVPSQRSLRWWSKRLQLTRSCLTFWENFGGLLVVQIRGVPPPYWWKISHCCYTFWEIWRGYLQSSSTGWDCPWNYFTIQRYFGVPSWRAGNLHIMESGPLVTPKLLSFPIDDMDV